MCREVRWDMITIPESLRVGMARILIRANLSSHRLNVLTLDRNIFHSDLRELRRRQQDVNFIPYRPVVQTLLHPGRTVAPKLRNQGSFHKESKDLRKDFHSATELHRAVLGDLLEDSQIAGIITANVDYPWDEPLRHLAADYEVPFYALTKEFPLTKEHEKRFRDYFLSSEYPDRGMIGLLPNDRSLVYVEHNLFSRANVHVTGLPRLDAYRTSLLHPLNSAPQNAWNWRSLEHSRIKLFQALMEAPRALRNHRISSFSMYGKSARRYCGAQQSEHVTITLLDFYSAYGMVARRHFPYVLNTVLTALDSSPYSTKLIVKCRLRQDRPELMKLIGRRRTRHSQVVVTYTDNIAEVLNKSDIIIGYNSTALLEAFLTPADVIMHHLHPRERTYFTQEANPGLGIHATFSYQDLRSTLTGLLKGGQGAVSNKTLDTSRIISRWRLAGQYVFLPMDSSSSQLIADTISLRGSSSRSGVRV